MKPSAQLDERGLVVRELTVRFEDFTAIQSLSMAVRPKSVLGVIGANGSGKSTFALAILGIVPARISARVDGCITVDGRNLRTLPIVDRCQIVSYVFQDFESQLLFGRVSDFLGIANSRDMERHSGLLLTLLGIESLLHRQLNVLSSGEAQKVMLAAAYCRPSKLVVYDETISYLDPIAKRSFNHVLQMLRDDNRCVILLGQREDVISPFCDNVVRIDVASPATETENTDACDTNLHITVPPVAISLSLVSVLSGHGRLRLNEIDLSIKPGETLAVMGENGSGKSTLIGVIAGEIRCSGKVVIGDDEASVRPVDVIDLVPHSPSLRFTQATCREELTSEPAIPEVLLNSYRFSFISSDRDPLDLSFGQQRLLAFCSAVLSKRSVILIDEPEQGLDDYAARFIMSWLKENRRIGVRTVVFSTHDFGLASTASRCIFLKEGRIVADTQGLNALEIEKRYFDVFGHCAEAEQTQSTRDFELRDCGRLNSIGVLSRLIAIVGFCVGLQFGGPIATGCLLAITCILSIISSSSLWGKRTVISLTVLPLLLFVLLGVALNTQSPLESIMGGLSIVSLCLFTIILFADISPSDLMYALRKIGLPTKVALAVTISFRMIPLLMEEAKRVLWVVRRRELKDHGFIGHQRSLIRAKPIRILLAAIIPLVVSVIRRIDKIVLAIDTQSYLHRVDEYKPDSKGYAGALFVTIVWSVAILSIVEHSFSYR